MASVLSPITVPTHLNYYVTPENGGQREWFTGSANNYTRPQDTRAVEVTDIRSVPEEAKLDVHGFQFVKHTSAEKEFNDTDALKDGYYVETAELLKNVTGASHVHVVSHFIRSLPWKDAVEQSQKLDPSATIPKGATARYCHVDQSYEGATELLLDNVSPAEADRLTQSRWAIINVWRPINATVRRDPLALCDARSVDEEDLYPVRLKFPAQGGYKSVTEGKSFEAWVIAANEKHKWYYKSEMTPEEVVLIKCFDSKTDGRARRCPHSAFELEEERGPPRESIEMRCLVFFEGQAKD